MPFFFFGGRESCFVQESKGVWTLQSRVAESVELQVNRMKIFCADLAVSIFGVCECL